MAIEIKIPVVGESISEVTISQWLKADGDYVEMDEVICELESDKATFELNAESAGILKIKVAEEETIEIGTVVCEIDPSGAPTAAPVATEAASTPVSAPAASSEPKATGETIEMKIPVVGESISEVTISSWMKADGDFVDMDEVLCELESDKATFDLNAESQG